MYTSKRKGRQYSGKLNGRTTIFREPKTPVVLAACAKSDDGDTVLDT